MKKIISLLLAAVMLFSVCALAGCGQKSDEPGSSNQGAAVPAEDNSPITIWQVSDDFDYFTDYNSHPITLFLEEKFGIDLSFQLPPSGGENDAFNLMASTGDFTDVISLGTYGNFTSQQLYDDGYLRDLAPYIEQYMPNYTAYLNEHPQYRAAVTTEEGRIFGIVCASPVEDELMWGGLVYRRDILETMTGGHVSFPSGNEEATTIADWEYMLDLYYQYFQAAGMTDYACLILPYTGVFGSGELVSGFGIGSTLQYVIDGEVKMGVQEQGYYNYLAKMAEWYSKGWIYSDFASRVNDPFYLPNTALTYGSAAGIWFGGNFQLGDVMSMPEYGLYFDVQPLATPLDTDHGVTESHALMNWTNFNTNTGFGITTKCSESKMIKYMQAMDYFFSEEGSLIVSYGLPGEYAANNATMVAGGLADGIWSYDENGKPKFNDCVLAEDGTLKDSISDMYGARFPGIKHQELIQEMSSPVSVKASETWTACGRDWCYPAEIALTAAQQTVFQKYSTDVNDTINEFTVKVITGQTELNEQTWSQFQDALKAVGIEELKAMYTEAYEQFMAKVG